MAINVKEDDKLIIFDGLNLTIVNIALSPELNIPVTLETAI